MLRLRVEEESYVTEASSTAEGTRSLARFRVFSTSRSRTGIRTTGGKPDAGIDKCFCLRSTLSVERHREEGCYLISMGPLLILIRSSRLSSSNQWLARIDVIGCFTVWMVVALVRAGESTRGDPDGV